MQSNIENNLTTLIDREDVIYAPVSYSHISKYLPLALIASEDQIFFEHLGFDFEQIEKAMKENTYRKRQRGASTITMQTAKNIFLWSGKSIIRKGMEAYFTLLLEILWSKKRIMEVYMNIAEMGKGIYGIKAGARIYFKKLPIKISKSEAATIAAILPNPKKRNPARPSNYIISRREKIMNQMNLIGGLKYINKNLD
jgi:monofunctional biosynthetic peptidoglycan transglycosylase